MSKGLITHQILTIFSKFKDIILYHLCRNSWKFTDCFMSCIENKKWTNYVRYSILVWCNVMCTLICEPVWQKGTYSWKYSCSSIVLGVIVQWEQFVQYLSELSTFKWIIDTLWLVFHFIHAWSCKKVHKQLYNNLKLECSTVIKSNETRDVAT